MSAVLFVDDDPSILQALERAMFRDRKRRSMVFVNSGAQALDALRREEFAIVISDLSMPEMDGLALLDRVAAEHPDVVRIILTGNIERLDPARTQHVHEVLGKPCPIAALRACFDRWDPEVVL